MCEAVCILEEDPIASLVECDPAAHDVRLAGRRLIALDQALAPRAVFFAVREVSCRLADIASVAQKLATQWAMARMGTLESEGKTVTCSKGCGACCRYLVPMAIPEALALFEVVTALPAHKRVPIVARFAAAARKVIESPPPPPTFGQAAGQSVGQWFQTLNLPCAVLVDGICDVYPHRPIACREHMVTSDPADCHGHNPDVGTAAEVPFSILDALCQLTAELCDQDDIEAVMMPVAMQWARINAPLARRTWRAVDVFQRFADILNDLVRTSIVVAPAPAVA